MKWLYWMNKWNIFLSFIKIKLITPQIFTFYFRYRRRDDFKII